MHSVKHTILNMGFMAVALTITSVSVADIAVIVNTANSVSSLSDKDLKRIYLGNTSVLADGSAVTLADQAFGSPLREQFYLKCCEISAQQARSRWAGILFSGTGKPPVEVGGDKEVISWVAGNKEAMGYVDNTLVDSSVKVLMILK